jgi:putative DNA primase/helicase
MDYEAFYQEHVDGLKSNGRQAYGRCPFHEDRHSSLSVNLFTGQFRCHGGGCGAVGNVITFSRKLGISVPAGALNTGPTRTSIQRSSPPPAVSSASGASESKPPPISRRVIKEYVYKDAAGAPVYKVLRYEPKGFAQIRYEGGAWVAGMEGVTRTLYHLPEMLQRKNEVVYLVEGEKDVETLESKGLVATTSSGGALNWTAALAQHFVRRYVVILPDNDAPGGEYAKKAATSLAAAGNHVKIVWIPGAGDKEDVTDFFNRGGTVEALHKACAATEPYREAAASDLCPVDYLRSIGVEAVREGGYLPGEYREACRLIFRAVSAKCVTLSDEAFSRICAAEEIWSNCTTKSEFEKFLKVIKEMHELSLA